MAKEQIIVTEPRTDLAWAAVIRALRQFGGYNSVVFDDPVITAVIKAGPWGGWTGLCSKTEVELEYSVKTEFKNLYDHFSRFKESLPFGALPGAFGSDSNGYAPRPYLVETGICLSSSLKKKLSDFCKINSVFAHKDRRTGPPESKGHDPIGNESKNYR